MVVRWQAALDKLCEDDAPDAGEQRRWARLPSRVRLLVRPAALQTASTLVFTGENYADKQRIVVMGIDDGSRDGDTTCRKSEFVQVAENASKRHFSGDFRKWSQNGYLERCLTVARLRSTHEQNRNSAAW